MKALDEKRALQLLGFLRDHGQCNCMEMPDHADGSFLLEAKNKRKMLTSSSLLKALISNQLLETRNTHLSLTDLGRMRLKRAASTDLNDVGGYAGQHRETTTKEIRIDGLKQAVTVNSDESPLSRLRKRRDGHGKPWIDDAAFHAGERLRRDFTIGGLMQKVTASWDMSLGSTGRKAGAGRKPDLTNSAIDARRRLDRALDAVGPELSGVLVDFCCFLKGLEAIERDRRWPPRSAKLMLRTGLHLLVRFYGLETKGPAQGRVRIWIDEGYRSRVDA